MLQLQRIREDKDNVIKNLKKKNFTNATLVDEIILIDEERKAVQKRLDDTLAEANKISKAIGQYFAQGKKQEAEDLKAKTVELKEESKELNERMYLVQERLKAELVKLPNLPHPSVPEGKTPEENEIVFISKEPSAAPPDAKAHWDLIKEYDLADLELGVKITGAGFPVYKGEGAKLQRSLISFFLDEAIKAGYHEVIPPLLVNEESAFGTGQLPDKDAQMYSTKDDPYYLIPTAEVPITNIHRDEILEIDRLPVKYVGYTPCFRREAGSYGKDVRGLNRVHQFDKVEIVQLQQPEKSYETLDEMVAHVESLLKKLELPYRILRLCGGDMSFASALTYDFEVYSQAQKRWLEVSSVSNFETFQSNRMMMRYRDKNNKISLVHTLNGSALALPRIVAALLENNQTSSGIYLPECLHAYTGFKVID